MWKAFSMAVLVAAVSAGVLQQNIVITGVAKSCGSGQEVLVEDVNVLALDPTANQQIIHLLTTMDTVTAIGGDGVADFKRSVEYYEQIDSLLTIATLLARDSTSSTGSFSLTVPAMDSVLVFAHRYYEGMPFYFTYGMVRAHADTTLVLDMSGECGA